MKKIFIIIIVIIFSCLSIGFVALASDSVDENVTINGYLTFTSGALNMTATSGALTLGGLSASSINTGANALSINSLSSGITNIGTGTGNVNIGNSSGASGIVLNSGTAGIQIASGDLTFTGTARYLVANDGYAFQLGSIPAYGLVFSTTNSAYEFTDGSANALFSFGAAGGVLGSLIVGNSTTAGNLLLSDGSSNYINISSPAIASNYNLTLPADDGDSGEVLTTDGSGILSWTGGVCGPGATFVYERGTITSNQAWSMGNGRTTTGTVAGCSGTVRQIGAQCVTAGTSLSAVLYKNGVATACSVNISTTSGQGTLAGCNESFAATDVLGIYAGTEVGAWTDCVGTIWLKYD